MSADRPLQTRDSEEYARARSLIQNAMDAVRHLSHLTQIFSSLVIPLGDEPPRNLNIINTRPHQTLSNFIIPSREYFAAKPSRIQFLGNGFLDMRYIFSPRSRSNPIQLWPWSYFWSLYST